MLNTENPEQLIYEDAMLRITVLGGIRLEGLDRLRATLKIELVDVNLPALRHNLDLYNDTQIEKLARRTAAKLEVGLSVITAALNELIDQLEQYRLEEIKASETKNQIEIKQLTTEEQQAATNFLTSENLLEKTNELIGKSGVVGEETNRLIMYLIFTSRKMATPLHVVSLGSSGTGKTHLQEKVGNLIPEEDTLSVTSLSENSFYYFERKALAHKLILIEDLDGAESALYPLRELQSKKKISKTVVQKSTNGQTRSVHLQVEGPVSVAGCTTKEKIYEDNANRSFLLYLDESQEQDQRIMQYQQAEASGLVNSEAESQSQELLRNCQRLLRPVKIINPYAEKLQLPLAVFKPRRTNAHYLQFIAAITFYHQWQRHKQYDTETGEEYIETTLEDIEAANRLLKEVLLRKSDNLTGACRNHFEHLKSWLKKEGKQSFLNREISRAFRVPLTTIKRYHFDLVQNGYVKAKKEKGSKSFVYQVVSYEEYRELEKQINTVLDQTLEQLKSSTNPNQPSSKSGPINNHKINKVSTIAQQPTKTQVRTLKKSETDSH